MHCSSCGGGVMVQSMQIKAIKTEEQYHAYLGEVQSLIESAPKLNSSESDRLELLTIIIESYENSKYPVESPDPVDAIMFRMTEKGLKQTDLVPYFGTRSRVSEVLNRKRPLTVQMIRALSIGLGISADTLVGTSSQETTQNRNSSPDWTKFPIKEMISRGWIENINQRAKNTAEDLVKSFINNAGLQFGGASFRRTISGEAESPTTKYALYAWLAQVIQKGRKNKSTLGSFNQETISNEYLKELAQLSWFDTGPLLAKEFLEKSGIALVIEPPLKGTLIDGAALKDNDGTPIIALSLRYDRIDNFWFTLMHEVVHIWKHLDTQNNEAFLDDLDASSEDKREAEANRIARDIFIPRSQWKRSEAFTSPSKESIERYAKELRIHPAIIAGRIRKETGNYGLFAELVGQNQVRHLFIDNPKLEA